MTQAIAVPQETNQSKALTDEQFMALPEDDNLYEYVNGELIVVANSGLEHGYLAVTLSCFLTIFVRNHQLGINTGYGGKFNAYTVKRIIYPKVGFPIRTQHHASAKLLVKIACGNFKPIKTIRCKAVGNACATVTGVEAL
jgi:hypothetical protein